VPQAGLAAHRARFRQLLRRRRRELDFLLQLRSLPPRVALFQWRAWRLAVRIGDEFSRDSFTRPAKLAVLLDIARGRRRVVELGTATGWTALSLLLADPDRTVVSYDPWARPERAKYARLVGSGVTARARFLSAAGASGPRSSEPVELLYIDSSHSREETMREVQAWRPVLADGAIVVFDDFDHPDYPGVRQAVQQLGLDGEERAGLFLHRITG